jgi:uncharacterized protein (TIGR00369 family)
LSQTSGAATNPPPALDLSESGLDRALGTELVTASAEEVTLRLRIGSQHLQPHGIVHGGVWASLAETAAAIGATLNSSRHVVGLENHTSFLNPVREGEVLVVAHPIHPGRSTQLWEVVIGVPDRGTGLLTRPAASARVRLFVLPDAAGT